MSLFRVQRKYVRLIDTRPRAARATLPKEEQVANQGLADLSKLLILGNIG